MRWRDVGLSPTLPDVSCLLALAAGVLLFPTRGSSGSPTTNRDNASRSGRPGYSPYPIGSLLCAAHRCVPRRANACHGAARTELRNHAGPVLALCEPAENNPLHEPREAGGGCAVMNIPERRGDRGCHGHTVLVTLSSVANLCLHLRQSRRRFLPSSVSLQSTTDDER